MAKAIKTLAIVSAFALVISSFGACSLPFGNDDPTTEVTTTEKQTEPTEPETTAETETETTTEAPKKIDTIKDIFADINNFPIGTAGSSAKAASLALTATVEDEDVYAEALYQVNSYAKKFFKGSQKDVVEIAGNSDFSLDKDYSQEKYQTVYEMLKK